MEKLSTVPLAKLNPRQQLAFQKVLKEASDNPYLSPDESTTVPKKQCIVILYGNQNEPVGFYCPKSQKWENERWWRAGTLFLSLRFRGKGIMQAVLGEYFDKQPRCLSWIEDKNSDSISLFKQLGFTKDEATPRAAPRRRHCC